MRSCATLLCACAALVAFAPAPASAQLGKSLFIGGGLTMPMGDYNDYAKPGWMGLAGISLSQPESPVWFGVEGFFGHNAHEGDAGDATDLYGGNAFIGYDFGDASRPHPYVYGSGGLLVHHYSPPESDTFDYPNENKFAVGGGVGLAIPTGGGNFWVEAKIMVAGDTQVIPFLVGYNFGI
ncbi:MAG: hypothetical protein PVH00_01800 [Gemmatimonadota bacterium]|jgi:hypothetical protein